MDRLALDSEADMHRVLVRSAACLEAGGVIAAPTETVYGLMTLWDNDQGRERIFELKDRPRDKRLQMLAPDVRTACCYGVRADPRIEALAQRFWPGPLTVVCAARQEGGIGLRIPDHPFILALLRRLGKPIAATSANLSGMPAAYTAEAAVSGLCGEPDLLIDGGTVGGEASTVASLLGASPHILRPGPIPEQALCAALAETAPSCTDGATGI